MRRGSPRVALHNSIDLHVAVHIYGSNYPGEIRRVAKEGMHRDREF